MGLKELAANWFFERPARKRTIAELAADLDKHQAKLCERFQGVTETPKNREWITHIVGIERWGQRRLQVALGEPFVQEEYDSYRPADSTPWPELIESFSQTRQQTLTLAQQLEGCENEAVPHNDFGDLSVKGWLKYLDGHANMTAKLVR